MIADKHVISASRQRKADLAVLCILSVLAGIYCFDAISASTHVFNLIMVLPLTVLVLLLCAIHFVISIRRPPVATTAPEPTQGAMPGMLLFAGYVLSLQWLGFDVGTMCFLGGFLWLQGERRWPWLFGYSMAFGAVMSLFFSKMLPYPMPLMFFDSLAILQ